MFMTPGRKPTWLQGRAQPLVDVGHAAYTKNVTEQARKILEQALAMPEGDRQRLAEALLDSIPAEVAEELERVWNAEALRRAEAFERGEAQAIDGDKAMSELRAKFATSRDA